MKLKWFLILLVGLAAAQIASRVALNRKTTLKVAENAASVRTFQVNGRVRNLDLHAGIVTVAHDEIPGFMPAMTMPLSVKDSALMAGLKSGDEIHFELSVSESDSWISHLEKLANASVNTSAASGSVPVENMELQKGELVPDFTLTDENGRPMRLSDFRGRAVVVTFVYTRCPLPNFCPLMSKNFAALQERLSKAMPGKYHLLSVTIDPRFDTPEVLKRYAAFYKADEKSWSFATGTEDQINAVTSTFGLVHEPEGGTISHNLRTALIGPDGRLVHLWKSNVWTPYEVQRMLEDSGSNLMASKVR